MRIPEITESSQPLQRERQSMGLEEMHNDEIVLYGGMRSGNSKGDRTRLRFMIFDRKMLDAGVPQEECEVGFTELFVMDSAPSGPLGDIEGLVNIEIKKEFRKGGYGSKVINALKATTKNKLQIYDVQKKAYPFWRKVGAKMPKPLPKRNIRQVGFAPDE